MATQTKTPAGQAVRRPGRPAGSSRAAKTPAEVVANAANKAIATLERVKQSIRQTM